MKRKYGSPIMRYGLLALMLAGGRIFAQDAPVEITPDSAIHAALANNRQIAIAGLDVKIAEANYHKTDAVFLPEVTATYTALTTNDPLLAFGFKLEQRGITSNDFNPALLNHPDAKGNFNAKLEVKQPLINPDMWLARKAAKMQTNVYGYSNLRTRQYVVFEVQQACLQLQLAYEGRAVLEKALATAHSAYKFANDHYKQGLIQKSDVLNAQVQVSTIEADLAKAKSNIENASDQLGILTGAPAGIVYRINGDFSFSSETVTTVPNERPDLQAMQQAVDASVLMVRSAKMNFLPKLNAFGNFQYNDSRLTGFNANSYFAGLQLSWDIFKGNRTHSDVAEKTLQSRKLSGQMAQQKEQAQLELSKALRDLADARFAMQQQSTAADQAAEALRILQNRYEQGLVNTIDLLSAQTQLAQRQLALAQAKFTQNLTLAYISLLTATENPQ
ncbi:MAG: TolC family protein [Mucilaginibacter sp.]